MSFRTRGQESPLPGPAIRTPVCQLPQKISGPAPSVRPPVSPGTCHDLPIWNNVPESIVSPTYQNGFLSPVHHWAEHHLICGLSNSQGHDVAHLCLKVVRLTWSSFLIPASYSCTQASPKFRKNWYLCALLPDTGRAGAYVLTLKISRLLVHWL